MEKIKNIKAKGLVIYFTVMSISLLSAAIKTSDNLFGLESMWRNMNNVDLKDPIMLILSPFIAGGYLLVIFLFAINIMFSILYILIWNLLFCGLYFKNIKIDKKMIKSDLKFIQYFMLTISCFIIVITYIQKDITLILPSIIYYSISWMMLQVSLRQKINKVFKKAHDINT